MVLPSGSATIAPLSIPLILDVLAAYDMDDAYHLLENEEIPGWLSMPENGATTVWEGSKAKSQKYLWNCGEWMEAGS